MKKIFYSLIAILSLLMVGSLGLNKVYADGGNTITLTFHEQRPGENLERLHITNMQNPISSTSGSIKINHLSIPLSPNYSFVGWVYYDENGDEKYLKGQDIYTESTDFYGHWSLTIRTVSYNLNGGINNNSNPYTFTGMDDYYLLPATKNGYFFGGWYDNAEFDGDPITYLGDGVKSKTLYAKWLDEEPTEPDESIVYESGFESIEGFVATNSYQGYVTKNGWDFQYGNVTAGSSPHYGNQHVLLRVEKNTTNVAYAKYNIHSIIDKITFQGRVTSPTLKGSVEFSKNGVTWGNEVEIEGLTTTYSTTPFEIESNVDNAKYFRIKASSVTSTGSNRDLMFDNVSIHQAENEDPGILDVIEPDYTITSTVVLPPYFNRHLEYVEDGLYKLNLDNDTMFPAMNSTWDDIGFALEVDPRYNIRFNTYDDVYELNSNIVSFEFIADGHYWELIIYDDLYYTNEVKRYSTRDKEIEIEIYFVGVDTSIDYTITSTKNFSPSELKLIEIDPMLYLFVIENSNISDQFPLNNSDFNDVGFSIQVDSKYNIRFNTFDDVYELNSNTVSFKFIATGNPYEWQLIIYDSLNYTNEVKSYLTRDQEVEIEVFNADQRPAIDGNEHFVTNVDSPDFISYFVTFITAMDDFDGDISHKLVIEEDNYTPNKHLLGQWSVTVSATDSSGNKSEFTFYVHVVDVTDPIATADLTIRNVSYDKTFDLNLLKASINATDNYYNSSDLIITLHEDNYTANKTILGIYDVTYKIKDPSDNETYITFQVKVIDGVAPIINGVTEIVKSDKRIMTRSEILAGITASDFIDGVLTDRIVIESDTYTGNAHVPNRPGEYYQIVISVKDNSNNKTTKTIKIFVIDDTGANWYITNGVTINLSQGVEMTRSQILDLLVRAGKVNVSPMARVIYTTDTYTGNEGSPGFYTLAFEIEEPNGNESEYLFGINVMSGENEDDIDIIPDELTLSEKIKLFFTENKGLMIFFGVLIVGVVITVIMYDRRPKRRR